MGRDHHGCGADFGLGQITHAMGFAVPEYQQGRAANDPEAGCPFGSKVPALIARGVKRSIEENAAIPVEQVWALTVDEIGSVMDRTPEGKAHMNNCPRCIAAFRDYAKGIGA